MDDIKIGSIMTFELMSVDNPPTIDDNEGFCIAFIPTRSFVWCRYWTGSKTWTEGPNGFKKVHPTEWLKLIKVENE